MDEPKRVTGKQAKALAALLDGLNLQDAAAAAGVNRKTLRRWLDDDAEFWRAYHRSSGASLQLAARRLTGKLDGAVALLGEVMDDASAPAGVRLRAAQLVLDGALRLLEAADIETRLAALEEQLNRV